MRVAVLFFPAARRDKLLAISKALAEGIGAGSQIVDIVDGSTDDVRLTPYEYIAIGTEQIGAVSGRVPTRIKEWLASAGRVAGKRCYAFLLRSTFRSARALASLMSIMEREGMILRNSGVIATAEEARTIGARLHI